MAFPAYAGSVSSGTTAATNVNDQVAVLPADCQSGELLVVGMSIDGNRSAATWPTGWTGLNPGDPGGNTAGVQMLVGYRISDGTEGGTSITVTLDAPERGTYWARRISGWHGTTPPESNPTGSSTVTGTGTAANPGSLTPSWGAADTLWIAFAGIDNGNSSVTTAPSSYTGLETAAEGSAGGTAIGVARRDLNASSEDPGAFANSSADWATLTLAVRPSAGTTASAGVATATGAANQPSIAITVRAGLASATGQAHDAVAQTSTGTTVQAGVATGVGQAHPGSVAVEPAPVAIGATGAASQPAIHIRVSAGLASATVGVQVASVSVRASAGLAPATVTAQAPRGSVRAPVGHASATVTAFDVTLAGTPATIAIEVTDAVDLVVGVTDAVDLVVEVTIAAVSLVVSVTDAVDLVVEVDPLVTIDVELE